MLLVLPGLMGRGYRTGPDSSRRSPVERGQVHAIYRFGGLATAEGVPHSGPPWPVS